MNVWELLTFFFWRSTFNGRISPPKIKKKSSRRQNNSKYCGLSLRKCNVHLRLRKCEKLPQTYGKLADLRLRNTSCSFAEFAVAGLSVNLRCPGLEICPLYAKIPYNCTPYNRIILVLFQIENDWDHLIPSLISKNPLYSRPLYPKLTVTIF